MKDWNACFAAQPDWDKAINIVQDRVEGRWLRWSDKLCDEQGSGFAVLALDCITLESLWGFIHGRPVPKGDGEGVYRDMLARAEFGWTHHESDDFRRFVRNGLMHDAETRSNWMVEMTVPRSVIMERSAGGQYRINRTKFHKAVRATFEDWMVRLRAGDTSLRKNMRLRMDDIVTKST